MPKLKWDATDSTKSALAESQIRLELATSAAGLGIWDWDLQTNKFVYTPRAREICGFPAEGEVTYDMVRAATHPEDLPWTSTQAERAFDPAIRSREPYEYRIIRPDGELRWVLAHGEAQFEPVEGGDRAVRYVGTLQDITERRSLDLQHVKLSQRLKLAIDAGRMAVWSVDEDGKVEASPEFNRLLKLPEDGQPALEELLSRYYPGELERVQQLVGEAAERGEKYVEWEYRHLWPNDEVRWLLVRAELLRHADGTSAGSIGVIMDVTDRRKTDEQRQRIEAELRLSERRLNAVLDNASVAILMMDEHQECSYMNAAAERLTGYSLAETQGRPLHDVIHHTYPDGSPYPLSECPIDRAFPEESNVQGEELFVHKDGTFFPVAFTASPIQDEESKTVGTIIEARDITAEKDAEKALQAQTTHLQILNETGAAIAAELDLERIVQLVTDAGVRLTKAKFGAFFYNTVDEAGESLTLYTLSGASRADFEKFGHPRATAVFAPTFKGEGVVRSDDITADPRYGKNEPHHGMPANHLPVRSYLALPVTSRSGEVIGGLFFGHPEPGMFGEETERLMVGVAGQAAVALDNARLFDAAQRANQTLEQRVTERTAELETAHEALRQAQKMEAVGQLTGGIAHDFNNLLTGVIGSLDMMQRQIAKGDSSKIERYATTAMTSANRAAALTHRLLAFSRRQPLDPKPVNANRLVTGMEELLRRTIGESVSLEVVTAGGLWQTMCDPHQLESAILNLAINARDAMPAGGSLTIETCNAHLDNAYAARQRDVRAGQYICICVTDTGSGMSKDTIEKAFEPFFTTKPIGQGTGLGLSMIYGFTRQSEGYARIYSELGEGTTVKLYLPRYYGEAEDAEDHHGELTDAHRAESGEVVLVVEDETAVRDLVVDVLQELGYRAIEAVDGPSGLKLLQSSMRIDLLVTDIGLPGLNGRQVADAGRQQRPGLKVLFMTGYAENATIANGFLEPGMEMITKPFAIEALATRVRDMIEE